MWLYIGPLELVVHFFFACDCSRSVRLAFVLVFARIWTILQLVEHISTLGWSISPHLHLSLIILFHWHALVLLRFWIVTSCKSYETSWVSKNMQLIGLNWCLWVPIGVWGCLMGPTGVWGCLLVSEVSNWCLRRPTDICGCVLVSEGICRSLLVSVGAYLCLRVPTGVSGCLLVSEGA